MSAQECWEDVRFCRVCSRDVPFISPSKDEIVRILRDSIRERKTCLEEMKTEYFKYHYNDQHEVEEIYDDKKKIKNASCRCPNGDFVNANGTIFYCDGPRILRVLNWDTCVEIGSTCTSTALKMSTDCLIRLSFGL